MIISGVHYRQPNGRKVPFTTEIPDRLREQWDAITEAGLTLAAEVLSTGEISATLEHLGFGEDFDIELAENAPGKPVEAVVAMIERFKPETFARWRREMGR